MMDLGTSGLNDRNCLLRNEVKTDLIFAERLTFGGAEKGGDFGASRQQTLHRI
jgi:hypothetical protein